MDAELAPTLDGDMRRLARHQVLAAEVAVLNKTDLVDGVRLQRAQEWMRRHVPHARIVEAAHGQVSLELLFDIGGAAELVKAESARASAGEPEHRHPSFDSYTCESEQPLPVPRLHALLSRLPRPVFRAKGIVNLAEKPGNPCVLQSAGRRAALTVGQPWGKRTPITQIVFIGSQGGVDGEWLEAQLTRTSMGLA